VWFPTDEAIDLIVHHPDEYRLLSFLRAKNHPNSTFMIADGLSETFSWRRQRLSTVRRELLELGYYTRVRAASQRHGPALYRWVSKHRPSLLRLPSKQRGGRARG
jgi:hypothetical protein